MQNLSAVAVPLDPLASYIYIQHETSRILLQPSPSFAWILPLHNNYFPNHRSIMILKCSFLWKKRQTLWPFSWMGFRCLKARMRTILRRQFFLSLSSQKFLVLIFLSTSEGQTTQILKSDPTKGVSIAAKMLFPQANEGFWLYYTSFCDTKISKLILCFSNLLL